MLQKMTFTYCYIGHICLTFQIASLQTSMIFGCRRTVLWTLFWTLCVPLHPLDTWYVHFQFKILKVCSKNDIHLLLHSSFLPHFPNSIVANFELQLRQQKQRHLWTVWLGYLKLRSWHPSRQKLNEFSCWLARMDI